MENRQEAATQQHPLEFDVTSVFLETTLCTSETTHTAPQTTSSDPGVWTVYLDRGTPNTLVNVGFGKAEAGHFCWLREALKLISLVYARPLWWLSHKSMA